MSKLVPILIAEDSEDDALLLRQAFLQAGVPNPLHIVNNGEEAIKYLKGQGPYADRAKYQWPGLLLLDLKMPTVDGFEVLAWLQKRRRPRNLDVIVLTSSNLDVDVLRALELGADAYLTKPHDFNILVGMIRGLGARLEAAGKAPGEKRPRFARRE
jgi:CheY-like chemotaxis protein